ncbi:hypothetical protein SEA_TYPHA_49 [Mycobacterium phage Typha]|uniref:Uncharacterized protein n=1 Tax=Mycobacterium phage Typha TaxID=2517971 RepID=A0A482JAI3_9CAUD|nr:hypothetical protein KCH40_gp120 [Mycobacterium phage Typha]QBP29704.1 hypothetical protein SEA_TYPHA_49 [Mycobacterium phage Typha]URM86492.1 hypothetical protein PBI_HILLTOPFARM_50 [Mycobacterium phage Hilltopfarm]
MEETMNPTDTDNYEFAVYGEVYNTTSETWAEHGLGWYGPGVDGQPPWGVLEQYRIWKEAADSNPGMVRNLTIRYYPTPTWTPLAPSDVETLPSIEDYSFTARIEAFYTPLDPPIWLWVGVVYDGAEGAAGAVSVFGGYSELPHNDPTTQYRNLTLAYAPRVTWSEWDLTE